MKAAKENVPKATKRSLRWLYREARPVDNEGDKRHKRIADNTSFEFLRATLYRWMQW